MLPRGLEEMIYRVRQELRRHVPHGDVEQIGIIRGNYDPASHRWYFKADVGHYQQAAVVMDAREMDMMGFNLPRHIDEVLIGRHRRGERYPDFELRSNGRVWNVPRVEPMAVQSNCSTYSTAEANTLSREHLEKYKRMVMEYGMVDRFKKEYMCNPSTTNTENKKSRKEQLAESRPARLARLWKAKYERDGVKPLLSKLQLV